MTFRIACSRLVLSAVLGLAALLLCGCGEGHWEDFEKVTGYRGKARLTPFLAAQRLLEEVGHDVRETKSLGALPAHSAVLFVSAEGGMSEGRARQLLSWTFSGGHLIYCLDGTRPYNDFDSQFGAFLTALLLEVQKDPLLERLGVDVEKRFDPKEMEKLFEGLGDELNGADGKAKDGAKKSEDADKADKQGAARPKPRAKAPEEPNKDIHKDESLLETLEEVRWKGRRYRLGLGGHQQLKLERSLRFGEFSAGPKDESLALHLQHGMGQVTLLPHARPLRNRWIGEHDHARWLVDLVGGEVDKEVLFVAASTGSFFGLLWKHGWMAVVAVLVCVVFWLWRQMPRFGPVAEVELDSTRHFASHIGALGEFFWRMKQGPLLLNAARDAVWARIQDKHRSLDDGSRQVSDELAEFLASRSGLSAKRVAAAFETPPPAASHAFVTLMRDLQTIRRSL